MSDFEINDGVLQSYKKKRTRKTEIIVPKNVTVIKSNAFACIKSVTNISIPSSVTTIEENAFKYCSSLISITVDDNNPNFTSINGVVYNKEISTLVIAPTGIEKLEKIPDTVTSIGEGAFQGCHSLTKINIPSSVTTIGSRAFYNCYNLNSLTIPENVTSIGEYAFYNCENLKRIDLPNTVISIDKDAFKECRSLTYISIPLHLKDYFKYFDCKTFIIDNFKLSNGKLEKYKGNEENVIIPNNLVTIIGEEAFVDCKNLLSITIPYSVTSIEKNAFIGCDSLKSVTIPSHLQKYFGHFNFEISIFDEFEISEGVLKKYNGEDDFVSIPENVIAIGESSFSSSYNLKRIKIPNSVNIIEKNAFKDCFRLQYIIIPKSVKSIGAEAFSGCSRLKNVTILKKLYIGKNAFDFENVSKITVPNPYDFTYEVAFGLCTRHINVEKTSKFSITKNGVLNNYNGIETSITIPTQVTSIGRESFLFCNVTKNIIIPDTVTSIGQEAFEYCLLIENITIPDSVTFIGAAAFENCESLRSIKIPENVTFIGKEAFKDCYNLKSINVDENNQYFSSVDGILYNKDKTSLLCVPCGKKEVINISDRVTSIDDLAFLSCESLKYINVDENNQYFSSVDGILYNKEMTNIVYVPEGIEEDVTILDTVTSIDKDTFFQCKKLKYINVDENNQYFSSVDGILYNKEKTDIVFVPKGIEEVITIPDTIKTINCWAFGKCKSLRNVTIPDSVTTIREFAFADCSSLNSITIPNSVTSIEYNTFDRCESLNSITIPSHLEEKSTYYECPIIISNKFKINDGVLESYKGEDETITIPESVTTISTNAFTECHNFTSIVIPESITSIEKNAFISCNNLSSITIPSLLKDYFTDFNCEINEVENKFKINNGVLELYSGYDAIVRIPRSVTSIGDEAFLDCYTVQKIIIPNSVTTIEDRAFAGCESLRSIIIPDSVITIGSGVFSHCISLSDITLSKNITSIKSATFYECYNLQEINIPNSVTTIEDRAFKGCTRLYLVIIPNSVTSIGEAAFECCDGLTGIALSDSVTSIGDYAFSSCYKLKSLTMPDSVISLGEGTFSNCISLESIIIPDSVISLGNEAFEGCLNLSSISIPSHLKDAFSDFDDELIIK